MKKIFLLSLLIVLGVVFAGQVVLADNASLYVTPATGTNNVGTTFSANVLVSPAGNKVCVVKGTLVFTNLACQSISVYSGLMAQTNPTCSSPSFTIGIPNCVTDIKNILSVSVKGATVGQAGLDFSGVKIIGVGVNVAFGQQAGTYTINLAPVQQQVVIKKPTVSSSMGKLFNSQALIIILLIIVLAFVGSWAYNKFYKKPKM